MSQKASPTRMNVTCQLENDVIREPRSAKTLNIVCMIVLGIYAGGGCLHYDGLEGPQSSGQSPMLTWKIYGNTHNLVGRFPL